MWLSRARRGISPLTSSYSWFKVAEFIFGLPGGLDDSATWLSWIGAMMSLSLGLWFTLGVVTLIWAVLEWAPPVRRYLAQQAPGRKRECTWLTAVEILAKFQCRTDAEARRMLRPHFGLWLRRVDGDVMEVVETPDTATVLIRLEPGHYGNLAFRKGDKEGTTVETLPVGARITATGRIEGIDRYRVYLAECELTDE